MKKRVKFISDLSCDLFIDAKQISLKARTVHTASLEEGVYIFSCKQNQDEISMEYFHINPQKEDLIKIYWKNRSMTSSLYTQMNTVVPIDPLVQSGKGAYRLYDAQTGWSKSLSSYDKVGEFRSDGYAEYEISGGIGCGLIDKRGNIFIPPRGNVHFSVMKNGYLIARAIGGGKSEVYNVKGELILEREGRLGGKHTSTACVCVDGLIRWEYANHYGYINLENEIVIPNRYCELERCGYDLFIATMATRNGGLTSIINKNNEPLFPFEHMNIIRLPWICTANEFVFVARKEKDAPCRLINQYNRSLLFEEFEDYAIASNKLWIKTANKWVRYNQSLEEELQCEVSSIEFIQGEPFYKENGLFTPIK